MLKKMICGEETRLIAGLTVVLLLAAASGCSIHKKPEYEGKGYFLPMDDPQVIDIYKYVSPSEYENRDMQWADNERDNDPVEDVRKRIEAFRKLEGKQMSFGREFRAESTLLLELYSELLTELDSQGRCEEAGSYLKTIEELYNNENLLVVYNPLVPWGLAFFYPDMEGYRKEPETYEQILRGFSDMRPVGEANCEDVEKKMDLIIYGEIVDESKWDDEEW